MSLQVNGFMTLEELKERGLFPSEERMRRGPVAVAECVEEIPCNPCETACRFHTICVGSDITNTPKIDFENCRGCGVCIAHCSGLAIFVMDKSYSDETGSVSFPYEYPDTPAAGDEVDATDRSGRTVCRGKVIKVAMPKSYDRTYVITVEVPIDMVEIVRGIAL